MRASEYEFGEFGEALLNARKQRNWLWFGFLMSLTLHIALCTWFYRTRFHVGAETPGPPPPPTFHMRAVDLNPNIDKNSADDTAAAAKPNPDDTKDQQPDEKKSFDKLLQDVQASAAMPDEMKDVLPDKPRVDADTQSVMTEIEKSSAQMLTNNPNATHEQSLLNDSAVSGRPQPTLSGTELATSTQIKRPNTFTSKMPNDNAGPNKGRNPGFSDLDQLLAQKGPLGSGTKLRMPDDQLFQYDSADLQSDAMAQLQKLGTLIKRNPNATFTVEGYTDSFGPPEYNLDLSQRRAETVKNYLVGAMGINPAQIQTHGYGQSKYIVPPNPNAGETESEISRQRANRRVEIVVHTSEH
ncbi:MAG: OmpA-OmpF porin, family [Verrucomicrobiota bacterium]|jgi:outer membrane protein OmpA-like peptidoglycan-associated protein